MDDCTGVTGYHEQLTIHGKDHESVFTVSLWTVTGSSGQDQGHRHPRPAPECRSHGFCGGKHPVWAASSCQRRTSPKPLHGGGALECVGLSSVSRSKTYPKGLCSTSRSTVAKRSALSGKASAETPSPESRGKALSFSTT